MVEFNREVFINWNDYLVGGREVRMRDRLCLNCNLVYKVYWLLIDFIVLIYLFVDMVIIFCFLKVFLKLLFWVLLIN